MSLKEAIREKALELGFEDAGFTVTRTPGFGRKRHMTRAVLA